MGYTLPLNVHVYFILKNNWGIDVISVKDIFENLGGYFSNTQKKTHYFSIHHTLQHKLNLILYFQCDFFEKKGCHIHKTLEYQVHKKIALNVNIVYGVNTVVGLQVKSYI